MLLEKVSLDKVEHMFQLTEDQDTVLGKGSIVHSRSNVANVVQFTFGHLSGCGAPDAAIHQELPVNQLSVSNLSNKVKPVQTAMPVISERAEYRANWGASPFYSVSSGVLHRWLVGHL